jgi:hypothetical protein
MKPKLMESAIVLVAEERKFMAEFDPTPRYKGAY